MGVIGVSRPDLAERNRQRALHGRTNTTEHNIWSSMIQRCTDPQHKDYPRYGGRGIGVCDRWRFFNLFLADMGSRPEGKSIDRIDNDADYSPENCRWASLSEQARNRRTSKMVTFRGETKSLADWADELGIERKTLQMRLKAWSVERALTTPYVPKKKGRNDGDQSR
jgi:hypothetical protein